MNGIITRNPHSGETLILRRIWKDVFGNTGTESFFSHLFDSGNCILAEINNTPAAAGYLVPFGKIQYGSLNAETISCAMIYSVATLPEYRGLGLGTAVVNSLINHAYMNGYSAVVLCPQGDGLFEYYGSRTGLYDWFYINELILNTTEAVSCHNLPAPVKITANEYKKIREQLLYDTIYIKHDPSILEYQNELCTELGGGLFKIGDSCAVIERQSDGIVWIKEFLSPDLKTCVYKLDEIVEKMISVISVLFPAREYLVRFPSYDKKGRRFGMIVFNDTLKNKLPSGYDFISLPWYGMAFD